MMKKPGDIFTEPTDVDPDTLANLGPLRRLAGVWQSDGGEDIAPKATGPESKRFVEHISMQPIDPQTNGPQLLYGLRYHIHITTPGEANTFHDQIGYWLWEPATGLVMQTLAIPRGQVALASGHADIDAKQIVVEAKRGQTDYGICSTDFLEESFQTHNYRLQIDFNDDGSWTYTEHTLIVVRGEASPFKHHDGNRLVKIAEPEINPWLKTIRADAGKS